MKRHKIIVTQKQALVLIDALNIAMSEWGDLTGNEWGKEYSDRIKVADKLCDRIKLMYWTQQRQMEAK